MDKKRIIGLLIVIIIGVVAISGCINETDENLIINGVKLNVPNGYEVDSIDSDHNGVLFTSLNGSDERIIVVKFNESDEDVFAGIEPTKIGNYKAKIRMIQNDDNKTFSVGYLLEYQDKKFEIIHENVEVVGESSDGKMTTSANINIIKEIFNI
ncbi:MAG: hypothetical protein FWH54_04150 [Methanobrevibacter sp.]|nr:hypothetical protein [Methanobrevibacter sp.]